MHIDYALQPCARADKHVTNTARFGLRLPLKTGVLSLVENIDKDPRDDSKTGACAVHAGIQDRGGAPGASRQAIAVVAKVLGIPKASLGNWVRNAAKGELSGAGADDKASKVSPEQMELARLRAENARLRMERDIAKSRGVLRAGHAARYAWIYQMRVTYPVSLVCEVLEVSASGYFNWLRRRHSSRSGPPVRHSDEAVLAHIRAIYAEVKAEYGWPRMHKELLARGIRVGKDRVRKLMQQHGIKARTKRKFVVTTDSRHSLPVAPDLVQRHFNPEAPNQLWSGDITYIATDEGWLYLAAVIDLFGRQVVGWSLQPTCRPAWSGRTGHGVVAPAPSGWFDIPQRQGQPVLQRGVPGCLEELGHALIDEQEGKLLGQRTHGKLLGPAENSLCAWPQICHP